MRLGRQAGKDSQNPRILALFVLVPLLPGIVYTPSSFPGGPSATRAAGFERTYFSPANESPAAVVSVATPSPVPAAAPTPTPASQRAARFRILAVRVEQPGAGPDWSFRRPNLRQVLTGARVDLALYVVFQTLPARARISTVSFVSLGGRVMRRVGTDGLLSQAQAGRLWLHSQFQVHSEGLYAFAASVTVNGHTAQQSIYFMASNSSTPARPQMLTFDQLASLDTRGAVTTRFASTDRVVIAARWTALNVIQPVSVAVTETLQSLTGNRWVTLGSPQQTIFDASGGSHRFMFSFVPGAGQRTLRIVVDVAVGPAVRERSIIIRVA